MELASALKELADDVCCVPGACFAGLSDFFSDEAQQQPEDEDGDVPMDKTCVSWLVPTLPPHDTVKVEDVVPEMAGVGMPTLLLARTGTAKPLMQDGLGSEPTATALQVGSTSCDRASSVLGFGKIESVLHSSVGDDLVVDVLELASARTVLADQDIGDRCQLEPELSLPGIPILLALYELGIDFFRIDDAWGSLRRASASGEETPQAQNEDGVTIRQICGLGVIFFTAAEACFLGYLGISHGLSTMGLAHAVPIVRTVGFFDLGRVAPAVAGFDMHVALLGHIISSAAFALTVSSFVSRAMPTELAAFQARTAVALAFQACSHICLGSLHIFPGLLAEASKHFAFPELAIRAICDSITCPILISNLTVLAGTRFCSISSVMGILSAACVPLSVLGLSTGALTTTHTLALSAVTAGMQVLTFIAVDTMRQNAGKVSALNKLRMAVSGDLLNFVWPVACGIQLLIVNAYLSVDAQSVWLTVLDLSGKLGVAHLVFKSPESLKNGVAYIGVSPSTGEEGHSFTGGAIRRL